MDIFKKLLQELHDRNTLLNDYQKTLLLLVALKAGDLQLDQIALTPGGWQILDVQIAPEKCEAASGSV